MMKNNLFWFICASVLAIFLYKGIEKNELQQVTSATEAVEEDIDDLFKKVFVDLSVYSHKNFEYRKDYPTRIVVHSTANNNSWADGLHHIVYQDTTAKSVSWHYTVDDKRIIKHHPHDRITWHAKGCNDSSIGIEVCQNEGADPRKTLLHLELLLDYLQRSQYYEVVSHHDCTGKECPSWEPLKMELNLSY